jgi:hypothetical protein
MTVRGTLSTQRLLVPAIGATQENPGAMENP